VIDADRRRTQVGGLGWGGRSTGQSETGGGDAANLRGDESPPALRFDAALGMRVFSAAGLRIGEGKGDTPDCPVDCHCCF
jgi:hypothetical protein